MAKAYSASMLKVLEGLDAVRMRPGMYIGSTGSRGLHHLLWEIVDNAIDEVANGYARSVRVELHKDGSASVEDDGRGVPVDIHPELGITGVEVIYTRLHAGGKFDHQSYNYSAWARRWSTRSPSGLLWTAAPAAAITACALRAITIPRRRRSPRAAR